MAELSWLLRTDRRDVEGDAEAIPLIRSLRSLRGESLVPSDDEVALDDAFVTVRWAQERAARQRLVRRAATALGMLAAAALMAPLARALLP